MKGYGRGRKGERGNNEWVKGGSKGERGEGVGEEWD